MELPADGKIILVCRLGHRSALRQDRASCGDTVIRDAVSAGGPDAQTAQASLLAVGLMRQLTSMIGARRVPSMCERSRQGPCVPNPDLKPTTLFKVSLDNTIARWFYSSIRLNM
jgi:hypothetical protein